jgi:hypothetical protein
MDLLVAQTDQGPPWIAVVAAIGGAAIGGVVAFLGSWWQEQRRWAREDQLRWDPARLSAYSRFGEAARVSVHRAELYAQSLLAQRRVRDAELNAKARADTQFQDFIKRRQADFERMPYMDVDSVLRASRERIDSQHLDEIRRSKEELLEEMPRLFQEFTNVTEACTRASAEISLIALASTAEKAALVQAHIGRLVGFIHNEFPESEAEVDEILARFRDESEQTLAGFELAAKTELTAPGDISHSPIPQIIGMARPWGRRRR